VQSLKAAEQIPAAKLPSLSSQVKIYPKMPIGPQ